MMPCYHVTTTRGEVYGVAATTVKDAMAFVQKRITSDSDGTADDSPAKAERVATWKATYGTVIHY